MNDRLYRSRTDRMLAGVAGGLAETWGTDPSLIRIVWALLVFLTGGIALVVYIVMAIVVPEGEAAPWPPTSRADATPIGIAGEAMPTGGSAWTAPPPRRRLPGARGASDSTVPLLLGAFFVLLGAFFLVREFLPNIDFDWFWPAALIALGVVLVVGAFRREHGGRGGVS